MPAGPEASATYSGPMWKDLFGRETNNGRIKRDRMDRDRMKAAAMSAWMMVVRQRWKPMPMLMRITPRHWL
jgi:hypothetical protein